MIICPCTQSDLSDIIRLENDNFSCPYSPKIVENMLSNPKCLMLKAVLGEVVGYVALEYALDEAELIKIVISKQHRQCGIGAKLMQNALEQIKNLGIETVFLEVNEQNNAAISLYNAFKFSIIGIREKYYGDRSAVIMRKNL